MFFTPGVLVVEDGVADAAGMSADCGFSVACGDPAALTSASTRLGLTADGLDEHAGTVRGAAWSLLGSWTGLAAGAYQDLSHLIAAHFHGAAGASRSASAALRRYSLELARCQEEGRTAVAQAEHFLQEIRIDTIRLAAAVRAVSAAEDELRLARVQAGAAGAAGPSGALAAAAANARVSVAQAALASAQADEQAARRALERARLELAYWQARGRTAWQEAQSAADQATGSLAALKIQAPPMPGLAASASGSRGAPAASSGKRGGGSRRGGGSSRSGGAPMHQPAPSQRRVPASAPSPRGGVHTAPHHGGLWGLAAPAVPLMFRFTQDPGGAKPAPPHPGEGTGVTVIGPPPPPHHSGGANLPNPPHSGQGSGTTVIGGPPPHPSPGSGSGSGSGGHKPTKSPPGTGTGTTIVGY